MGSRVFRSSGSSTGVIQFDSGRGLRFEKLWGLGFTCFRLKGMGFRCFVRLGHAWSRGHVGVVRVRSFSFRCLYVVPQGFRLLGEISH